MTAENQPLTIANIVETCEFLKTNHVMTLGLVLIEIGRILPGHPLFLFRTLKLKVGKNLVGVIDVFQAIMVAHHDFLLILDGNGVYTSTGAIQLLQTLHGDDLKTLLLLSLGHVTRIANKKYGVYVEADEKCHGLADAEKIVQRKLADVINIKISKLGVLGALEVIELARASDLHMMIGGMAETRLAIGFAGHFC
ncbi:L-Ala-D/L-amino acid epimerase [Heracleum sosnowskyi]|uniref:L-Ala-D/L-amino acid epimerase n=1 Tax=Heracleum sosnowskyi TaxID=360622 RepID=A0AAD8N415_9APIA|nr:L-Ala-D/L-amino acid epimerase [Heracleum sosnowskyi]